MTCQFACKSALTANSTPAGFNLKGLSINSLENLFSYTVLWNGNKGKSTAGDSHLLARVGNEYKAFLTMEYLSWPALHRLPTDLNGHGVMLNGPCGGAEGKSNT